MLPQMPKGHLSNSGRRKTYSITNDDTASPSDYSDPLYLLETRSKLVSQIRNLKKEIEPLVATLKKLQDELDPGFSDNIVNIEISQKIASLQEQQFDFDKKISRIRRQYSCEAKEKLDFELNHYRVILNESRFDLNKTNKMLIQAKAKLQSAKQVQNSSSNPIFVLKDRIEELRSKLNSLRQTESDLTQQNQKISNYKNLFYDQIDSLSNILKNTKEISERKKSELWKLKIFFENRKNILIAQIESKNKQKNKQQTSIKHDSNSNSNFNSSLRRIVAPSLKKTNAKPTKKVQMLPSIAKSNHSYCNTSGNIRNIQQKGLSRSRTPRRNELDRYISQSHHKLELSSAASPVQNITDPPVLSSPKPSKHTNSRNFNINLMIADPSVKIVKMQKNNDEFNDFISFS